ncbi:MAG: hypothetical protein CMF50_06215 [Legionellales bacterium]|nr:hypothetical protein [Legionellales bacterium]|tara:strand:- start:111 stop:503 length:393 start_codon:yes stop_codon:yes gene_type:complete
MGNIRSVDYERFLNSVYELGIAYGKFCDELSKNDYLNANDGNTSDRAGAENDPNVILKQLIGNVKDSIGTGLTLLTQLDEGQEALLKNKFNEICLGSLDSLGDSIVMIDILFSLAEDIKSFLISSYQAVT